MARAGAIIRVYRLKGGQRGFGDNVVNVAQDVKQVVTSLNSVCVCLSHPPTHNICFTVHDQLVHTS